MAIKPTIIQAIPGKKIKASEYNKNFEKMFNYIINTAEELNTFVTSQVNGLNNKVKNMRMIGQPIIRLNDVLQSDEIRLEGARVSRITYATLFSIYGTTYGAGDGSTTFDLPDARNRAFWGASNFGYIAAGLPNIYGTFSGYGNAFTGGCFTSQYWKDGQDFWANINNDPFYVKTFNAALSSIIYGRSNTVQPDAIKFRVVTRYK